MKSRISTFGSLLISIVALAGLITLIIYVPPTRLWLTLAIFLVMLVVGGLFVPIWQMILHRFLSQQNEQEINFMGWRFGLWTGIFVASLIGLKILGFADRVLILAIFALLMMLEMFLQQNSIRQRSSRRRRKTQRKPEAQKRKRTTPKNRKKKSESE